jgi:recombination associated protein RdgC
MWFKNLILYRLASPLSLEPDRLDELLLKKAARPCAKLEFSSYGWTPPLGRLGKTMTQVTYGNIMICARKEEKVLPASVIREMVEDRLSRIEQAEARRVARFERQDIRDEVLQDLLPKALVRVGLTYAYVDLRQGWLLVDAASSSKAEELTSLLRSSVDGLSIQPLTVDKRPATVMTGWLERAAPKDFSLEYECELRDPMDEGGIVRCRQQDLDSAEIRAHLDAGKQVARLALNWDKRLSCLIGEDLTIKRLRFSGLVLDEAAEAEAEDAASRFDADFAIMSLELNRFLPRLFEVFGGLATEKAKENT